MKKEAKRAGRTDGKLVIVLSRAHHSLVEFLEGGLALQGILTTDFSVLEVLPHKGPLAIPAIDQKLPLRSTPVRGAINRLALRGLIRRQEDRNNRNAEVYELLEEGNKVITRIYERHEKDIEAVLRILSPEERNQLWDGLKKIGLQSERCKHTRSIDRPIGLAPWQLRRAIEYMTEHLADSVSLEELARQTGLSSSRFGRVFKLSMGLSPHRWQLNLRIVEAQELLRKGELSLAEIALATGFAEQSHFSRIFKKVVGAPPGAWQREHRQ